MSHHIMSHHVKLTEKEKNYVNNTLVNLFKRINKYPRVEIKLYISTSSSEPAATLDACHAEAIYAQ